MYCGIVGRFVGDSDDDSIIFLGINNRPRIHFVDCDDILGVAQLCNFLGLHLYIIIHQVQKKIISLWGHNIVYIYVPKALIDNRGNFRTQVITSLNQYIGFRYWQIYCYTSIIIDTYPHNAIWNIACILISKRKENAGIKKEWEQMQERRDDLEVVEPGWSSTRPECHSMHSLSSIQNN